MLISFISLFILNYFFLLLGKYFIYITNFVIFKKELTTYLTSENILYGLISFAFLALFINFFFTLKYFLYLIFFFIFFLIFKKIFQNKLKNLGIQRSSVQSQIIKNLQNFFSLIKEIKIYSKEKYFKNHFLNNFFYFLKFIKNNI